MITFIVSAIRLGMAFLLGCTGEIITEKSGHLNLGLPGVMCVGASCGCVAEAVYYGAVNGQTNPVLAVIIPIIAAMLGAALMGLLFSFFTVTLRANQNVTGLVLTTLGVGLSKYMISLVKDPSYFSRGGKFFRASIPVSDKLGWFGELFFSYGVMVYIAVAIAIAAAIVFSRTRVGLHLRAVGENPATADAAGINVTAYRYTATCIGCGIAGLGGLSFIMDYLGGNWEYVVDAIGWLAVALVIFTVWKPALAVLGSLVFGGLYVASSYLNIPSLGLEMKDIFKMLPYVVTIIVLIITSMRKKKELQPPQCLGISYFREER